MKRDIIIGARASKLSLIQVSEVIATLKKIFPSYFFIIKTITTRGDRLRNGEIKTAGIFVKEIEKALLKREIDIAVHSLKDLPTELPEGLVLAAVTKRKDAHDALVSRDGRKLSQLKKGAVIGTSSFRRKALLLSLRSDLKVIPLRGNVDTRLKKLEEGIFDGIICSYVALKRLRLLDKLNVEKLPLSKFIPAAGQAVLGLEVRDEDYFIKKIVARLNHKPTYIAVQAERQFIKVLGVGCRMPAGAFAEIKGDKILIRGFISDPNSKNILRDKIILPLKKAKNAGKILAEKIMKRKKLNSCP